MGSPKVVLTAGLLLIAVASLALVVSPALEGIATGPAGGHVPLPQAFVRASPRMEQAGSPPASSRPASAFGLAVGDQVDVAASSVACRQAPAQVATLFAVVPQYEQGIIVAGSVLANGYIWWEVSWDSNYTGWSAEGSNGTAWLTNLTGKTVTFDRAAALAYAAQYWGVVTSDGYFWNGPSTYVSYAQGTSVVGLSGDDCAHFVSQVIGDEPHQAGGGLNIPSRVPPTYGEPGNAALGDMILNNGWGIQVNGVQTMEPGDVINYEWNPPDGTWDHIAVYVGNGGVAAHTNSHFGANWTLGGAYAYRFIHILATTAGGSGVDHPAVSLALSPSTGNAPLNVSATATVVGGSTVYPSYLFLWGDGTTTTSSTPTASHVYNGAKTYMVDVRVTDSLGAVGWAANQSLTVSTGSSSSLQVTLHSSSATGTAPAAIAFQTAVQGGSGTYTSYAWSFGDGATSTTTLPNATHTYTSAGTFAVQVTVTDSRGSTGSSNPIDLVISAPPPPPALAVTITATPTSGGAPLAVSFSASPTGGTGTYGSFAWSFGDALSSTTSTAQTTHTYASPGTFSATVTVSDGSTQATSAPITLTVTSSGGSSSPLVVHLSASPQFGGPSLSTQLTLTVSGGSTPYRVAWDYGDGTSAGLVAMSGSTVSVSHTYSSAGTFTAKATVVDASGTSSTAQVVLEVNSTSPGGPSTSSSSASSNWWNALGPSGDLALLAGLLGIAVLTIALAVHRRRRAVPPQALDVPGPEGGGYWSYGSPPDGGGPG